MFRTTACLTFGAIVAVISCGSSGDGGGGGAGAGNAGAEAGAAGAVAGAPNEAAGGAAGSDAGGAGGESAGAAGESAGGAVAIGSLMPTQPGSNELSTLSDTDAQTLCAQLNAYYVKSGAAVETLHVSCLESAMFAAEIISPTTDAEARDACQTSYDDCLKNNSPGVLQCNDKPTAACKITIDQYTACLNDGTVALHEAALLAPDCQGLTKDNAASSFNALAGAPPPESCQLVSQQCPELWGSPDPVSN